MAIAMTMICCHQYNSCLVNKDNSNDKQKMQILTIK